MSEITPNTPNPVREDAYKQELATKLGIDPQYIPGSPIWHSEEEIAAIAEMFSNMAGGSSGGGVLVVRITENDTGDAYVADKTYNEVLTAYQSGQLCLFSFYGSACVVSKDEDYPELYGSTVSVSQNDGGGGTLFNYYIEYTTSGVTVITEQYSLTAAN